VQHRLPGGVADRRRDPARGGQSAAARLRALTRLCLKAASLMARRFLFLGARVRDVVDGLVRTRRMCAVGAAIHRHTVLDAVSEDPASAVRTGRCQLEGGALKTVEREALAVGGDDLERAGVVVSANVAACHRGLLDWMTGRKGRSTRDA